MARDGIFIDRIEASLRSGTREPVSRMDECRGFAGTKCEPRHAIAIS
jgi:hypothetical protein